MRAYWKIFNPWYMMARHREMVDQDYRHRLVARHINNGGPILDVGGTERANIGLYVPNYTVTVNNDAELKPNLVWDGCDLPFKSKSFPFVVSIAMIHLVKDKHRFLAELNRVASERVIIYDCLSRTIKVMDVIDIE